jgi:hypothetical protein
MTFLRHADIFRCLVDMRATDESRPNPRWIYPAGLVLGAILTHLASEFFGMGADADAQILLSPRHAYLALAAVGCAMFVFLEIRRLLARAQGPLDLRRQVSIELARLPLSGDWRFCSIIALVQFAVGLGTAIGEGCFFCGHDAFFGVAGALLTATVLALIGKFFSRRLSGLAAALASMLLPIMRPVLPAPRADRSRRSTARPVFWFLQLANRPPPIVS